MTNNLEQICDLLSSLTVLELSELSKKLETKWGVTAMSFAAPAAQSPSSAATTSAAQEQAKDKFEVVLVSVGENKINVIKEVRAITNLGLKEAKDLVEGAPKTIKSDVAKTDAEEMKKKLESAGAKVELK